MRRYVQIPSLQTMPPNLFIYFLPPKLLKTVKLLILLQRKNIINIFYKILIKHIMKIRIRFLIGINETNKQILLKNINP